MLGMRIAGARRPIDRLKPHQAHQTTGPAAPDTGNAADGIEPVLHTVARRFARNASAPCTNHTGNRVTARHNRMTELKHSQFQEMCNIRVSLTTCSKLRRCRIEQVISCLYLLLPGIGIPCPMNLAYPVNAHDRYM